MGNTVELQSKGSRMAVELNHNRSRIPFGAFIQRTLNPVKLVYDPDLPDGLLNLTAVPQIKLANISAVLIAGHLESFLRLGMKVQRLKH